MAVVESQLAAICFLILEHVHGVHGGLDVDKVGVGETSGLAGTAIDGDADVNDIANATEEVVQIAIGHFERHVADEKGTGRFIFRGLGEVAHAIAAAGFDFAGGESGVLHNNAAAFEVLLVESADGCGGGLGRVEVNIAKAGAG